MEKSLILAALCVEFLVLDTVHCFPIDISSVGEGGSNPLWLTNYFLTGIGFFLISVIIIFGCLCCRNGKGFKQKEGKVIQEFSNSSGNLTVSRFDGFVNPTLNSELTIFPPLGGASCNEICRFEPLPDVKYQTQNLRPAAFSYTEQEISSQDWFLDPHSNFPRNQLKYVQEYGRGWFGRVVEGEAQNITPNEKVTKVMVKILHEDATPTDHMYFLHEVKFYRDLKHSNILRLLGQCLEMEPFLIILECYPNGDLKSFLSQNLASAQALVEQGVTLKMCSNITSGLQFMHDKKFIHTDLAARNCLVGPDLTIKIGDYGNSIEVFKADYYCTGSVALPVRWCAPETLKCTDITIETREVTPPANIWSLGIVLWEICEFCKLPYSELNDDDVIVRVLGEKNYFLEKPNMFCLHKDELYHLMKLCWKPPLQRPSASQIYVILNNLISSGKAHRNDVQIDSNRISQDFEQRWQNFKPNSIPKKDDAVEVNRDASADCSIISLKFKNAKVVDLSYVDSPLGIFLTNKTSGQESPRFCLKNEKRSVHEIKRKPATEVQENVNEKSIFECNTQDNCFDNCNSKVGEIEFNCSNESHILNSGEKPEEKEPEVDSWLKGVEINNEEDESFVRKISEAIRDLDATLAMEKTSSSEENSGKSTRQNSPGKDVKETNEITVDFKLGQDTSSFRNFTKKTFELSSLQNTEQPQSLNFTNACIEKSKQLNQDFDSVSLLVPFIEINKCKSEILDESLKENDSLLCGQSRNSSDTDDEIWRRRIEKGEISEKVKEKSKSIANLMILTHIDSDDSDIDFEKPLDKGLNRSSFNRRSGSFFAKASSLSNNFGSENDLTFAVLEDDFKKSLKELSDYHKEHGHFDSLGVILPSHANRENIWENLFKSPKSGEETRKNSKTDPEEVSRAVFSEEEFQQTLKNENNFLGNAASEKLDINIITEVKGDENSVFSHERHLKNLGKGSTMKDSDKNVSVEIHSKCDSETNKTDCVALLQNSSHLKESDVGSHTSVFNTSKEGSPLKSNENESVCASLKVNVNEFETFNEYYLEENVLLESSQNNKEESFTPFSKTNDVFSFKEQSHEMRDLEDVDLNFESRSDETISEHCGKESEFIDKLSGAPLIPRITITGEPEEKLIENSEEMFVTEMPDPKSLKFILKDFEIPLPCEKNQKADDFINLRETPISNILVAKSTENLCKKFVDEENLTVVVGACEDFTMDYFKGLKTTSEDINMANKNTQRSIENLKNREENLDVWDKHLEKALTQQLNNTNFDDISFRTLCLDSDENADTNKHNVNNNFSISDCSIEILTGFIESERFHTEKLEESIQISRLTNLSVLTSEEEYEHFKLRTPDDERSSDSGFRDKGSLSESVEDACEGKYNLEDIEAELEEAFVKGVFTNFETDREKDISKNSQNYSNFEYEESKFYEDENRNEEDFSDIDGEIEFWQNKDESDYYPEISEFNPNCSQGWYLHPPDENVLISNRNINEDIVKALRNELQENLPIQNRSFDEFNDFYEREIEDSNRDVNIHYISEFSFPLSPILEEEDSSGYTSRKNVKNFLLEGNGTNKVKKNVMKLIESAKAIDTNIFMQYLDYMIENEGRDFNEIEEVIENSSRLKENFNSSELALGLQIDEFNSSDKKHPQKKTFPNRNESAVVDRKQKGEAIVLEENSRFENSLEFPEFRTKDDILVINLNTNEANLLEKGNLKSHSSFDCIEDQKDYYLDVISDNSENDGLIFTPEVLSPDKERSFSEISRSSNGTRTGDALSEITLSSPDLEPDCFSTLNQETVPQIASKEVIKEPLQKGLLNVNEDSVANAVTLQFSSNERNKSCEPLAELEASACFLEKEKNALESSFHKSKTKESELPESKELYDLEDALNSKDLYEMSTSFMGDDGGNADDEDNDVKDIFSNYNELEQKQEGVEESSGPKTPEDLVVEDRSAVDWQSESSGDEELSSSSEEFIWKDGNKESKIKASHANDFSIDKTLCEKAQSNPKSEKMLANEPKYHKSKIKEEEAIEAETHGSDDDDNESSTGSSASFTDFVPSAWNSQATPSRSVLKSPDNKTDKQKKNVWFKKQKYHCVYEYPREPSDSEDADSFPFSQSSCEKNLSEASIKHFNYGVNTVELPNKHFPYGISKVIDLSTYTDWEVVEEDVDLSLTDTDSDNGSGKSDADVTKNVDCSFYNLSPFDYDFNTTDMPEGESEFFVSSSSRPFQGGSSSNFSSGLNTESKTVRSEAVDSKDFVTPDSGIEDCTNALSPTDKIGLTQENIYSKTKNLTYPNKGVMNILDSLNFSFLAETNENSSKEIDCNSFEDSTKAKNGFSISNGSIFLPNNGLGQLKHTRNRLKLDLSHNHNSELGSVMKVRKE